MDAKRIGIYVRVSTNDQSTELQEREIAAFLDARAWHKRTVYEDKGTGTNGNRAQLKHLLKDARERKLDVIIVWKLDRLFRSLKDLVVTLQEFSELGIDFISLKDNIDLTTSAGRLLLHIIGAFAQFEADIIKERVRAGLSNARAKGTRLGRPQTINAASVLELKGRGLSLNAIAKQLGISKAGVHKTLSKMASTNPSTNSEIITKPQRSSNGH